MDVNIDDICHTVICYYFLAAKSAFRAQLHGTSISYQWYKRTSNGQCSIYNVKALFLSGKIYPKIQVSVKSSWSYWYRV